MKQINNTNLNPYNQPINAPVSRPDTPQNVYAPWQYGRTQKIAAKQIRLSKVNVKNSIQNSALATASGTFGNGATLDIATTLTPNAPHANELNFATPYVALYQGTAAVAANQIYPGIGANITPGQYLVYGDLDYNAFATTLPGSVISAWSGYITNVSAGNQSLLLVTQWKFFNQNSGSVTG